MRFPEWSAGIRPASAGMSLALFIRKRGAGEVGVCEGSEVPETGTGRPDSAPVAGV
ncbi:hypothetical protein HanPSC8_Chr10g0416191 [Helianthus annuus]|nr:hypothetical protein HanPSC8_Chr10g0416191 [Helianthus annuus]